MYARIMVLLRIPRDYSDNDKRWSLFQTLCQAGRLPRAWLYCALIFPDYGHASLDFRI